MRTSYLDYAMSVIVGRALPDVRDGLKPVHRRVLFSMNESGLQPNRPYSQVRRAWSATCSASTTRTAIRAAYDALVRMAQWFSLRYPLVDGQGNFGNQDGYSAAAMRYTECRLSPLAVEMLRDIDADTVDFMPNYDERRREPIGAAVAVPEPAGERLVRHRRRHGHQHPAAQPGRDDRRHHRADGQPGCHDRRPDDATSRAPTSQPPASIMGMAGIREAYETGRGRVVMRAKVHTEDVRGGKTALIVTEMPYMVKKGGDDGVIQKIAELVESKVLNEISALNDESDRTGMRIYIELKRDAIPKVVLNKLYKHTALQSTFGVNMVALVDGVNPRTLSLKQMLYHYIEHQKEVVTRRTKFELDKAEKRAHVLEGYLIALDHLDEVIALIRAADDAETARNGLMRAVRADRDPGPGDPGAAAAGADRPRAQARSRTSTTT